MGCPNQGRPVRPWLLYGSAQVQPGASRLGADAFNPVRAQGVGGLAGHPEKSLACRPRARLPLGSARPLRLHLRPGCIREGSLASWIISINISQQLQNSNAASHADTNQYK
jgi:hypothetical protein